MREQEANKIKEIAKKSNDKELLKDIKRRTSNDKTVRK